MTTYYCRTDKGFKTFTEDELYRFSMPEIMKILRTKYTSYARHHEDLAQEAMAAVFKSMGDYNAEKGTLNAYVHGVAARAISKNVRTIIRRESKESELTEAVLSMTGEEDRRWEDGESPEAQEAEFEQLVERFKTYLTKEEKKALELKLDGLSNTEIYNELHPRKAKRVRIGQAMTAFWDRIALKYIKFKRSKGGQKCK